MSGTQKKGFFEGGFGKYLLPGILLQSVLIGGGYATGREIVSYGAKFGAKGWVAGIGILIGFAVVAVLTFEISRLYKTYDYKSMIKVLIGPAWPLFDVAYVLMMILVIAIMASASGSIVEQTTGLNYWTGVVLLVAVTGGLMFFGDALIERFETWGTALRNHLFPDETEVKPNLMAFLIPMDLSPKEKEFHTITLEDTRFLHCNIKTLNLIPSVIANQKAKEAGCQEVIFHRGDRVTEMAHSNVSFLIDGTLVYHPFDNKVLPGIAIKHLIKTAEKLGVPTRAEEITVTEAMNADELIITSSGTLCNRITEVDKIPVGGKADELFHKLQDAAWDEFMVYTKQK